MAETNVPVRTGDAGDLSSAHDAVDELRAEAVEEAEERRSARSFWRELPILVGLAVILAVVLKVFVIQAFWIPSSSMEPTLQVDDRVAVSKVTYLFRDVARGDVIVFDDPDGPDRGETLLGSVARNIAEALGVSTPKSEFIKRVIAVGGDTVQIRGGIVLVNGVPLDEPYARGETAGELGPMVVPARHVFVLGDNRAVSRDSRLFGPVPEGDIVGRAFSTIWPPGHFGGL